MANRKLGNLGNIIPSFLISELSIFGVVQNRKLGFKNLFKSEISEDSEFSTWPSSTFILNFVNYTKLS